MKNLLFIVGVICLMVVSFIAGDMLLNDEVVRIESTTTTSEITTTEEVTTTINTIYNPLFSINVFDFNIFKQDDIHYLIANVDIDNEDDDEYYPKFELITPSFNRIVLQQSQALTGDYCYKLGNIGSDGAFCFLAFEITYFGEYELWIYNNRFDDTPSRVVRLEVTKDYSIIIKE